MSEMDDIIKEFLVESNENLDQLDAGLVDLEKDPDSQELLGTIFRAIHTVKGTGGVLGFPKLESIAHGGENLLSKMRDGQLRLNTKMIWGGMLQIELIPTRKQPGGSAGIGACVQITGAWEGAVRVDCSRMLARLATARFLGVQPEEVDIGQMRDAMGELANMSAGSVKPLLPSPSHLSLPSVADGSDFHLSFPQGEILLTSNFEYEGEIMMFTLLRRKTA